MFNAYNLLIMENIKELENKILKKNKNKLATIIDPLNAGLEEMQKSFSSIFYGNKGGNKITIEMEKFEKKWIEKNFKNY
jgi:hypothetical protein